MLRTITIALYSLIAVLALAGCPTTESRQAAGSAGLSGAEPASATVATETTTTVDPATGLPGEDPIKDPAETIPIEPWQVANISLGLSIDDARQRLPIHDCIPIEETWATAKYTGILTAGTYEDPVGRVLSVVCFEGKVAGVVDSIRETEEDYAERFQALLLAMGQSHGATPGFADGRQFIYEMINAEPAPDFQYMWADEDAQAMFFAAHFTDTFISNYVLIDAAHYDYAAAEMAQR